LLRPQLCYQRAVLGIYQIRQLKVDYAKAGDKSYKDEYSSEDLALTIQVANLENQNLKNKSQHRSH